MMPAGKIWMNGKLRPSAGVKTFPFNQGLNYGATVYDGIRCYDTPGGPALFRLDDHLDRFMYSAGALRMDLGYDRSQVEAAVIETVRENGLTDGYVRPMAFYSEPKMGINVIGSEVTVLVLAWPWRAGAPTRSVKLHLANRRRLSGDVVDLKAKVSGYYAGGLLGFLEAREAGADEPLLLDDQGNIAEGAINNIFFVKDGALHTPKGDRILQGITRDTVLRLAKDSGLTVTEEDIAPESLVEMDEAFLTGTGIELESVASIKGLFEGPPKPGPVTSRLERRYREAASGRLAAYKSWLTRV